MLSAYPVEVSINIFGKVTNRYVQYNVYSSLQFENRLGARGRDIRLREGLTASWRRVASLLLNVFSNLDHGVSGRDSQTLYLLGLECALSWLKFGSLPLETTSHIYNYFLQAALHYAPHR